MAIQRIESVTFGVENLDVCVRYFEDAGFEEKESDASGATFRTPANQFIRLLPTEDGSLPDPVEPGSTIREIVWGVDEQRDLDEIGHELSKDRNVAVDSAGVLHAYDLSGYAIGFAISNPRPVDVSRRKYNVSGNVDRLNEPVQPHTRAYPLRIIHAAFNIPKEGHEEANAFYTRRLKFKAIDTVRPMGTFMQCEGDIEHHNFLLCHRPDRVGFNHIALEVRDIDEVVEGGNYMNARGWKESRRFGRHNLGSNVFRMFHAPCGGRIEFAADMDRMDKSFEPRVWDETPPHNHWMLKTGGSVGE